MGVVLDKCTACLLSSKKGFYAHASMNFFCFSILHISGFISSRLSYQHNIIAKMSRIQRFEGVVKSILCIKDVLYRNRDENISV